MCQGQRHSLFTEIFERSKNEPMNSVKQHQIPESKAQSGRANQTLSLLAALLVCCGFGLFFAAEAREQTSTVLRPNAGTMKQSGTPSGPGSRVKPMGVFLDIKHSQDDTFGFSLQLWQEGNSVVGLFSVYVGPQGDAPTGLLEDITFDPRTGQLSFAARLSTGLVYGHGYQGVPSRDIFQFRGTLHRNRITGALKTANALFPSDPAVQQRVSLQRSADMSQLMEVVQTSAEWQRWAEEVLRRRGPKW